MLTLTYNRDDSGCEFFTLLRRHELFLLDHEAVVLELSDLLSLFTLPLVVVYCLLVVIHVSESAHELGNVSVLRLFYSGFLTAFVFSDSDSLVLQEV